jgi:hypothetical protein
MDHQAAVSKVESCLHSQGLAFERLPSGSIKRPACLGELQTTIHISVPWAEGGVVLFLKPAFPYIPALVFYPPEGIPKELVPHVDYRGEICVLPHNVVVNPEKPEEHVVTVLSKARELHEKVYSNEELLAEVEAELTAYWKVTGNPVVLIKDDSLESSHLVKLAKLSLPPDFKETLRTAFEIKAITQPLATTEELGVEVLIDRSDILQLVGPNWLSFLKVAERVNSGLNSILNFIENQGRQVKHLNITLIFKVETKAGSIRLAGRFTNPKRVKQQDRKTFVHDMLLQLEQKCITRLPVEDCRYARILNRSAGVGLTSLVDARVALVGCGSIGGLLAELLAGAGISHFLLIDNDTFEIENLGRHILDQRYLSSPKTFGVSHKIRQRFSQANTSFQIADIRDPSALQRLSEFKPTLIISATGDTNTDLLISERCRVGELASVAFIWVEAHLKAGHLVFQPTDREYSLCDLHPAPDGIYKFQVSNENIALREGGCNTTYTPYSALDMNLFVSLAAKQIIDWLLEPRMDLLVQRWRPETGQIEVIQP